MQAVAQKVALDLLREKLYEIGDEADRLSEIDGIGIVNEVAKLKALVGQLDHLVLEYRRQL